MGVSVVCVLQIPSSRNSASTTVGSADGRARPQTTTNEHKWLILFNPKFMMQAYISMISCIRIHDLMISFSRAKKSAVLPQYSVCLSVCLSVAFRYRYRTHIGWNSSKIITRPSSLRLMRWLKLWKLAGSRQSYFKKIIRLTFLAHPVA